MIPEYIGITNDYLMIFENLKLTEPVLRALQDEGYITPTPIQAKAIPCVLDGKDLLVVRRPEQVRPQHFRFP